MSMKTRLKLFVKRYPFTYKVFRRVRSVLRPSSDDHLARVLREILQHRQGVKFVQIGSNDGMVGDPLYELIMENKSWSGVFVEPVRYLFERLRRNYADADRFIFENVAIGATRGSQDFYYVGREAEAHFKDDLPPWYDQLGSFRREHIIKALGSRMEPFIVTEKINTVPLNDVLAKNGIDRIDLLHIDTEGYDYQVLAQLDFSKYQPLVILFEHKHLSPDEKAKARALLAEHGYMTRIFGGDTLAVKADTPFCN
ncbi:MAG TPA: FkbM family methyltransferase [Phycisphaerae bacterium]|mgnify:CR=1 FL=1|jgi:FkbM family methyltransferase|nr:FkbM family methyltransferase [Phycisphaerae bacterium]HOJ53107.1 FkbM family methyltransferase [Phycisphaerae bacterium]HOL24844.1 FkbM family methyltransferase [Phycisphaerae bacterium]HPP19380.1 FkbM family methyltransferase [Phycisphaerae bacterium]HPU32082.1 FkbM family methyltransferase [Phycisphaerae bacterium]